MSTRVSSAALEDAVKEILAEWSHVKSSWRDAKAMEFEKTYIEKIPEVIAPARTVIEDIDVLLRKVRNDCE
jgi:hypothetical protein